MSSPIHVACAADDKYAVHCAAMLHSLLENAGEAPMHVHFLHGPTLSASALGRLRVLVERYGARWDSQRIADASVEGLPRTPDLPRIAWYRILLPELFPALDRVLYLDCDVIVRESVLPLWETSLDHRLAGAVRNVTEPRLIEHPRSVGIPADQPFFNSGVKLLNLDLMRRERCTEQVRDHARAHAAALLWLDQESLNYVLGRNCVLLHPRWNCQNSLFFWPEARRVFGDAVVEEATRSPAILHFEGPGFVKPWHYLNRHPFREEYWRSARSTTFPPPAVEGRTLANVARVNAGKLRSTLSAVRRWIAR